MTHRDTLVLLPVRIVETDLGVLVSRGATEFRLPGDAAKRLLPYLLGAFQGAGATPAAVAEEFPIELRPAVLDLIDRLVAHRLLVPADEARRAETPYEVFCWDFGVSTEEVARRLADRRLVVLGLNEISRRLIDSLHRIDVAVTAVDDPALRNPRVAAAWPTALPAPVGLDDRRPLPDDARLCLIATSDAGATASLREWNRRAVRGSHHFLPVCLHRTVGTVGPFVVPGETPCFECLRARENACLSEPLWERASEAAAADDAGAVGWHPAMTGVLGEWAAFELTRAYAGLLPPRAATLLEVDLIGGRVTPRPVLRLPRCPVCSALNTRAAPLVSGEQVTDGSEAWSQSP